MKGGLLDIKLTHHRLSPHYLSRIIVRCYIRDPDGYIIEVGRAPTLPTDDSGPRRNWPMKAARIHSFGPPTSW
jgi:hypothetical protein